MKILSLDFFIRWTFMFFFSSLTLWLGMIGIIYFFTVLNYVMGNSVIWVIPIKVLRGYAIVCAIAGFFTTTTYVFSIWYRNRKDKDFT
jgi:hypothetical protein